jgi:hypothetical protein
MTMKALGIALRSRDGVVHWAPFGGLVDDARRRAFAREHDHDDVDWAAHCEDGKLTAHVSFDDSDVTCFYCLARVSQEGLEP